MSARPRFAAMLVVLLSACTLATAQSELLELVPDDALGIVVVNRLAETSAKLEGIGEQLQVPMPPPLGTFKSMTGLQKGIDESKAAGIVLLPTAESVKPAAGVLLIPVKDYKQLIEQLRPADANAQIAEVQIAGAQALVASKQNYAAFSLVEQKPALERFLNSKKNLGGSLEPISKWMTAQDAFGLALPAGIKLGTKRGLDRLSILLEQLENAGDQQKKVAAMLEPYREVMQLAQRDVTHVATGFRIDKSRALHLATQTLLIPESSAGRAFGEVQRVDGVFHGLPNEPYAMLAGTTIPQKWLDKFGNLFAKLSRLNPEVGALDEKQVAELVEAQIASLRDAKSLAMFIGPTKSDESAYANTIATLQVEDATAYILKFEQTLAKIHQLSKNAPKAVPQYETKHIKVGNIDALEITMDMSAAMSAQNENPAAAKMLEKFMGPGGKMKMFAAPADKTTVVMAYVSQDNLERGLAAVRNPNSGLKANAALRTTVKLLPRGSQWMAFVSPRESIQFFTSTLAPIMPGGRAIELPDFPQTPPVGLAAKFATGRVETELVIPPEVTVAAGKYIQTLKQSREGAEAEQ